MRRHTAAIPFLLIAALSAAPAQRKPLEFVRSIPLPAAKGPFSEIAYDREHRTILVCSGADNVLEAVNAETGAHLQTVIGMNKPRSVAYIPGSGTFTVANAGDGTFKIFDAATFQIKKSVPIGENAECIRYDPVTKRLYAGYGKGSIAILDAASYSHIGDLELPDHPRTFVLENPGQRIFALVGTRAQVTVIDKGKNTTIGPLPMKAIQSASSLALDDMDGRVFVGCRKPAKLLVFNTETLAPVAAIAIAADAGDISYDNVRRLLYVSCGGGSISVIQQTDPDHYHAASRVQTAPGARTSLFVQELDLLFLAVPRRLSQNARLDVYRARGM